MSLLFSDNQYDTDIQITTVVILIWYDNPYDSDNRYIVILSHSSAPSYHNMSLCPYIMDRLHGKFLMGIQLWGNMVQFQSSLMRGRYGIMRKLDLKILILVIKFFKIVKGCVILATIVPWFKRLLHYIFLFYLKKRSKI